VTQSVCNSDGARVQQIYSGTYTSTTIYLGAPAEINILGAPLPPPTSTIPPTMTHHAYLPLVMGGQPIPPRTQPFANETWKMYYATRPGNQVAAMRVLTSTGSTLYYLRSDHLGSTSVTMDASGTKIGEMRYKPYGEIRYTWGISPTDISYTGQRLDSTGLMFYQARYYSPLAGRFASADTLVPDGKNPQQFNRYSYGLNNPVKYLDPSGHDPIDAAWEQAFYAAHGRAPNDDDRRDRLFSLLFSGSGPNGSWTDDDWAYYSAYRQELWNGQRDWLGAALAGLDRFTAHLDTLASYYKPGEEDQFVKAIGFIWGGIPLGDPLSSSAQMLTPGTAWANYPPLYEGVTNWSPGLVDDENPSHHYAGLVYFGYFFGAYHGETINWLRDGPLSGYSQADIDLVLSRRGMGACSTN
jgi:RHS repeat-associated protein